MFQTSNFQAYTAPMEAKSSTLDSFIKWKKKLNLLYLDAFGTTADNLPDMPYRSMFKEEVKEEYIISRMRKIIGNFE